MFYRLILLVVLVLCLKNSVYTQELVIIDTVSKSIAGKQVSILVPGEEFYLKDVLNAPFLQSSQLVPNLGIQKHSVWLKFVLENRSSSSFLSLSIGNNTISEAILYFQRLPNLAYDSLVISNKLPINDRLYKGSDFIFGIDQITNLPQNYYLKIKSSQPIVLPLNVNLPSDQLIETVTKNWLNGIYFGMILIMSIYNFFLYLSIRERSYIYYVAFILSSGLTQLSLKGIAFQYFWPDMPSLEVKSVVFWASLSGIFALLFTKYFLDVAEISKKWNRFILLLTIPFAVSILLLLFNYFGAAFGFMQVATSISSITILIIAIFVVIESKNSYAIYFLISSSFLIIGSIIFLLKDFNLLPYNFFTNYSVQIASAIQMTLLSFALANRINILKKEKELSRLSALRLARENEWIVKQQNIELEQKVKERTFELNQSLEDLMQTQTKLVAAEKMSSLGQLTAGIAHEINNPINFVAANVKPLKRDVFQLFDVITTAEEIYGQSVPLEQKQSEFATYKEEMDFDFLKIEITQLLKGIREGASRTAEIVKGLRAFSRQDGEEFVLSNVNDGLTSTFTISSNLLKEIALIQELQVVPLIECNPGRLNQVFLNILTNAVFAVKAKFESLKGGEISVRTYSENEFVFISIEDNGIGMNEEAKLKLFQPFFTTKPVGEGTGLGMSIAYSFIEQHQGKLFVESEINLGTKVILRLPITKIPN